MSKIFFGILLLTSTVYVNLVLAVESEQVPDVTKIDKDIVFDIDETILKKIILNKINAIDRSIITKPTIRY